MEENYEYDICDSYRAAYSSSNKYWFNGERDVNTNGVDIIHFHESRNRIDTWCHSQYSFVSMVWYQYTPEPISFDQFAFVRPLFAPNICDGILSLYPQRIHVEANAKTEWCNVRKTFESFHFQRMRIKHLIHHKSYSFRFSATSKKKTTERQHSMPFARTEGAAVKQTNRFLISLHISLLLALYFFPAATSCISTCPCTESHEKS